MSINGRPILFSAPMVRALLAGNKTQTRRVIKPQPDHRGVFEPAMAPGIGAKLNKFAVKADVGFKPIKCPYGRVGELLYVKETWRPQIAHSHGIDSCDCEDVNVTYIADGEFRHHYDDKKNFYIPDDWQMPEAADKGNVPSIFMPRWASRLTLEITAIRAERLHDISENDAVAEGCSGKIDGLELPSEQYRDLWKSINGNKSWNANPWVWVVQFKVHHKNIKELLE